MSKKSKEKKRKYLELLTKNLHFFYPRLSNTFMCPICFDKIDLGTKNQISEAHIVPKAAGGKEKTLLCRKCNSFLGSKQDKWFGELVRLVESSENIVQTRFKEDNFYLCGRKVGGNFEYSPETGMRVLIRGDRNSPEVNDWVLNNFKRERHKTFGFSLPILSMERMITVGYLTAAYLLFFATFGYSWALQSYLDIVRRQILNPDEKVIKNLIFTKVEAVPEKSWIGVVQIAGYYTLAAGFSGYMIIIPPLYCENMNLKLTEIISKSSDKTVNLVGFYRMHFINQHFYDTPVCLLFDNRVMFAPDAMIAGKLKTVFIYFSGSDPEAKFLYPVDDEQYQDVSPDSKTENKKVRLRRKVEVKYFDI